MKFTELTSHNVSAPGTCETAQERNYIRIFPFGHRHWLSFGAESTESMKFRFGVDCAVMAGRVDVLVSEPVFYDSHIFSFPKQVERCCMAHCVRSYTFCQYRCRIRRSPGKPLDYVTHSETRKPLFLVVKEKGIFRGSSRL